MSGRPWLDDARLLAVHRATVRARAVLVAAAVILGMAGVGLSWPRWLGMLLLPVPVAAVAAIEAVAWLRRVEQRRGWPEPGELRFRRPPGAT